MPSFCFSSDSRPTSSGRFDSLEPRWTSQIVARMKSENWRNSDCQFSITDPPKSVEVTYDPSEVTYGQLLQVYFSVAHNPTQLNYQGPDHGTQYCSTIFVVDDQQKKIAQSYIAELDKAKVFGEPIVTTLEPFKAFYRAEDYHQDFLTLNPTYPYIVYNDLPKVVNLKQIFPNLYRDTPVLVSEVKS